MDIVKKSIIILFLLIYTGFTAGVTIKVHDCGGEHSASLALDNTDPCTGERVPMADMCCSTELKTEKISDAQTTIAIPSLHPLTCVGIVHPLDISPVKIHHTSFVVSLDTSPPPNEDIHISNSVFLI